jgi:hypothetical protein
MCFNDWRIGRLIRSKVTIIGSGGVAAYLMAQNNQRVGFTLMISSDDSASGEILSVLQGQGGALFGFFGVNSPQLHATLATHGDLPTRPLYFDATAFSASFCTLIEYFATEPMLTAALQDYERQYPGAI